MLSLVGVGMQRIVVMFLWWRKDGLLEVNQQEYVKKFISVEGGSTMDVTRRFGYALGLISQLKVNVSYSEVAFPGLKH
eukprot:10424430-Ditylum_brightwellii.AAC.1